MKVCLNGRIIDSEEALLPFSDRGVLFGDGVFETIRAYRGKPFRIERHLKRLHEGCLALRISPIPLEGDIIESIAKLYDVNVGTGDAYIRITLTGGLFDGNRTLERSCPPNVYIEVKPFEPYPEGWYENGMKMVLSEIRVNESSPLSQIKSNNYLNNIMAKHEARSRGADDAVMLNSKGFISEATSSNIFLVRNRRVYTPGTECGLLRGITREAVIELCESNDIPFEESALTCDDLLASEEVFISVSTGEIVPVREFEEKRLGKSCPGPVTANIAVLYENLIKKELFL